MIIEQSFLELRLKRLRFSIKPRQIALIPNRAANAESSLLGNRAPLLQSKQPLAKLKLISGAKQFEWETMSCSAFRARIRRLFNFSS